MSDADPRKSADRQAKPKPAAPRGRSSQSRKTKRPASRKKRPFIAIRIDPNDAKNRDASLSVKLKEEARSGLPGLAVSAGTHLLILGLLWLIVVAAPRTNDSDLPMEFGWISSAVTASDQQVSQPMTIPIKVTRPTAAGRTPNNTAKQPIASPNNGVGVSPTDVKNILNGRDRKQRGKMLEKYGGGKATERAVNTGLMWLKRHQRTAGNWSLHEGYPNAGLKTVRTNTGATAMALLAYLGTGHTHTYGDHRDTVSGGLKWLMGVQQSDGNFFDLQEYAKRQTFYAHAQATIVLCEAYAMTGDDNLRESAEAGVGFLIRAQQPINGGWKYAPQDEKTVADLSVTGWALMALHTARVAGLDVPVEVFELSSSFLNTVQEQNGAHYKYEPSNSAGHVTVAMTAEGLLCRQYLGWPPNYPQLEQGLQFIAQSKYRPEWTAGRRNVYEWYYVGHVLHNGGGKAWKEWYQAAQQAIVPHQIRSGSNKGSNDVRGSWHPTEPLGSPHEYADKAGRLYMTAMCILILEMPYRHLPIYDE